MKNLYGVIFWGALWGITEATIGNFLHSCALPIGWLIWFPLASSFMWLAYRQTGQPGATIFSALIAASIKMLDIFTTARADLVINPAVSILFEGLAVFVIFKIGVWLKKEYLVGFLKITLASVLWRTLFCGYLFFLPDSFTNTPQISGLGPLAHFVIFQGVINSLLIFGVLTLFPEKRRVTGCENFIPHPVISMGMLFIAGFVQWRF